MYIYPLRLQPHERVIVEMERLRLLSLGWTKVAIDYTMVHTAAAPEAKAIGLWFYRHPEVGSSQVWGERCMLWDLQKNTVRAPNYQHDPSGFLILEIGPHGEDQND